jgi:hypothetical protein
MTVTNNINNVGVPVTQSSQLISVLLGMEVNPTWASSSHGFLDGYAGLGLLPSFIFTGRGGADGGSTYFGLLFEGSAGVRFHIYKAISLDVGVSEIVGTIQGSSAAGFGVNGGLRIAQ